LYIYWRVAPLDDARVRQALSLAIDRQAIVRQVYHDTVQPSIHLIPEGMAGYNAGLADAAGRSGAEALPADLLAARQLANAYAAEKCRGNFSNCPPVTIEDSNNISIRAAFTAAITSGWQQAFPGWTINIAGRHSCPQAGCPAESHPLFRSGWLADYPDPQDFMSLLWTTQAPYNIWRVNIAAVDTLCAQADVTQSQGARLALYQQAEQLLITQVAAIPLYQSKSTYAVRSYVMGWRVAAMGTTPLSVWQQVYIKR
jgi:oligopeptide transport system substrate-binding protein